MATTSCIESQSKNLKDSYLFLCGTSLKKRDSSELLDNVHLMLENKNLLNYLFSQSSLYSWKTLVKHASVVATKEFVENHNARSLRSFKRKGFAALKAILSYQFDRQGEDKFSGSERNKIGLSEILDVLLQLLRYPTELKSCHEIRPYCVDIGAEVVELLLRALKISQAIEAKPCQLKRLWNEIVSLCDNLLMSRDQPAICRMCTNVMLLIAQVAHRTLYVLRSEDLLSKVVILLEKCVRGRYDKDETLTNLLVTATVLMKHFAAERRTEVIVEFSPVIRAITIDKPSLWSKDALIWQDHLFPDRKSALFLHKEALFEFIDSFLALCCPDCMTKFATCPDLLKLVAELVVEATTGYCAECCAPEKAAYRKSTMMIEVEALDLVGRCFVLDHILPKQRYSKRSRCSPPLLVLLENSNVPSLQVFEVTLRNWKHCFADNFKSMLASELLKEISCRKIEELFPWYLKCCIALCNNQILSMLDYESCCILWKFAISCLHGPSVTTLTAHLLGIIALPCANALNLKDTCLVELLTSSISKLDKISNSVIELLAIIMSQFEFDERMTFRASELKHPPEWRYRCEAVEFIFSRTEVTCIPFSAIVEICRYIPSYEVPKSPFREICYMEKTLMNLFGTTNEKNQALKHEKDDCFIIEVLYCLVGQLAILWQNAKEINDADEKALKQAQIWSWLNLLMHQFRTVGLNEVLSVFASLNREFSLTVASLVSCDSLSPNIIAALDIGEAWSSVDASIRNAICTAGLTNCQMCSFAMRLGQPVDENFLVKVIYDKCTFNKDFGNYALQLCRSSNSMYDVIHLMEKFAPHVTTEERKEFLSILCCRGALSKNSESYSESFEPLEETQYILIKRLVADLILRHFPEDELIMYKNLICEASQLLVVIRGTRKWLTGKEFMNLLTSENMYEEIRARLASYILSTSLLYEIHLPALTYLVEVGSASLYQLMKLMLPRLDEVIMLFTVPLADYYVRKKSCLSGSFLPEPLRNELLRNIESQYNDFQSFTNVLSDNFGCLSLRHVKYLFLQDTKILQGLFSNEVFTRSFWALLITSSCWFFVVLRDVQSSCKPLNYLPLVLRSLQLTLSCYKLHADELPSISQPLRRFIAQNIISLSSSSVRDYCESGRTAMDLLPMWLDVFHLLLYFDEKTTKTNSLIVFENFSNYDVFKSYLESSSPVQKLFDETLSNFREMLKTPVVQAEILTERYWTNFYRALLFQKESSLNERELQRVLYIWMRYVPIRKSVLKVIALSQCSSQSAFFSYSDVSCTLDTFIVASLLELFLDPFSSYPVSVYVSICEILAAEELREQVAEMAAVVFSNCTEDCLFLEKYHRSNGFLYDSIYLLLSGTDALKHHLMVLSSSNEIFGCSLLPYLVELAFKSNSPILETFCLTVNQLLKANDSSLFQQNCPIIVTIVSCIRRLQANVASFDFQKKFPIDFVSLSAACLKADLIDDAYFFLRCYIDLKCDDIRPSAYSFDRGYGLFQHLKASSSSLKLENHFQATLVALQDADTLRAFSLPSTETLSCRLVLAENACNWQHLAFLTSSQKNSYLHSRALFYCGAPLDSLESSMKYRAAAELAQWHSLSFPKRLERLNRGQRLYFLMFTRHQQQFQMCQKAASRFALHGAAKVANLSIINQDLLKEIKEAYEFEWLIEQKDRLPSEVQFRYGWLVSSVREVSDPLVKPAISLIVSYAEALLSKKAYQPALRLIEDFRKQLGEKLATSWECELERARVLEACNESEAARSILTRIVCDNLPGDGINEENTIQRLKAYSMLADFEMRACRPDLAVTLLQKAVTFVVSNSTTVQSVWLEKVHRELASYSEKQYLLLEEYKSSDAYKTKVNAIKEWDFELQKINKKRQLNTPLSKAKLLEERRIKSEKLSEENDLKQFELDYSCQVSFALKSYLFCLEFGVSSEDIPYRILPILVNMKYNEALLRIVTENLTRISSHHWVPLTNHLCSHLFDGSPLALLVYDILTMTVSDYPFHTINNLLFYVSNESFTKPDALVRKEKVEMLIKDVCTKRKTLSKILTLLQQAFNIYCKFASADISNYTQASVTRKKYRMDDDSILLKEINLLRKVPIPSISQPLTEHIEDMITFDSIEAEVIIADGISRPYVLTVIGSDGVRRKLIFKKEDLRNDSLVEQLFSVVNILLREKNKDVFLRTYHVLPLNQSVGIIEWCLETMSLCEYLCGFDRKSGAHFKYYPKDLTAAAARNIFSKVREEGGDLRIEFERICEKIHPVFRHFFYERFFDPLEWRSRIRNYSVSVAQWSIVGYVVGLGDRHLNNILVDLKTAQLVHIDLGMVFEFGKRNLPIPERVPFRLTRDTIDPMLVEGVNGRFKTCAVDVMDQLRANSQALIGLALVLLNDPLCAFGDGEKGSKFSSLAICRLRDKLAGIENRVFMTAEQQVSSLITEAMNTDNLARMFVGWMPFL